MTLNVQDCFLSVLRTRGKRKRGAVETYLFIPELDQSRLVDHDLIALALAGLEQLWQSEPLTGHLVSIIGVHELVVIDTVWCVPLDTLNCRLAAVKGYDIVDKALTGWRKLERLGRIRSVVLRRMGLARLELLAGSR